MIPDLIQSSVLTLGPHDTNNLVLFKYSNQRAVTRSSLVGGAIMIFTVPSTSRGFSHADVQHEEGHLVTVLTDESARATAGYPGIRHLSNTVL
jgi:hypothetical protein